MAAQAQPPQQPVYTSELNFALDRLYARLITYVDARIESLMVQMRIDKQESINWDNDLKSSIKRLADAILTLAQQTSGIDNRTRSLETTQQAIIDASKAQTEEILRVVRELHAEAMGAINDLRQKGNEWAVRTKQNLRPFLRLPEKIMADISRQREKRNPDFT